MAVLEALEQGAVPIITEQCNLPELFDNQIALRIATDFTDFGSVVGNALAVGDTEQQRRSEIASAFAKNYHWDVIAKAMIGQYAKITGAASPR
jgi:glycosyltransferase involved in cell wall biosynthesis